MPSVKADVRQFMGERVPLAVRMMIGIDADDSNPFLKRSSCWCRADRRKRWRAGKEAKTANGRRNQEGWRDEKWRYGSRAH
jgi:hypothetical protein